MLKIPQKKCKDFFFLITVSLLNLCDRTNAFKESFNIFPKLRNLSLIRTLLQMLPN